MPVPYFLGIWMHVLSSAFLSEAPSVIRLAMYELKQPRWTSSGRDPVDYIMTIESVSKWPEIEKQLKLFIELSSTVVLYK